IRFIVNTHYHVDHTGADEEFAKMGATILSHPQLRARLAEQKDYPTAGLPMVTYSGPVTLYMNGEQIELIPLAPAHTDGDTMIFFHHADILHLGDFFRAGY